MNTSRRSIVTFGLATTLLVAACGGGNPATSGPAGVPTLPGGAATQAPGGGPTQAPGGGETVDVCALLTAEDIQDVTGDEIASSAAGPQAGVFPTGCEWVLIDGEAIVPPSISLGVMKTGGRDYYDRYFAPFNEEGGYEPIDGLGDEAVDAAAGAVLVVSGDTFLQVQYLGGGFGSSDEDTALATELARKVVANLGG